MAEKSRDTIDHQIDAAISRTEEDLVRDTVKIRLIREKIQVSELVGYVLATVTVVLWVSGGSQLLYLLIVAWVTFLTWWSSLYWKLFQVQVAAERASSIRKMVDPSKVKKVEKVEKSKAKKVEESTACDKASSKDGVLQKRTFDRSRFAQILHIDPDEKQEPSAVKAHEKKTDG